MGGKGNPPAESLSRFTNTLEKEGRTARQSYMNQGFEALNTGGVGAQIPLLMRAMADQKRAFNTGLRQSQDLALRSGGGDVLGQQIVGQRLKGEAALNRFPVEFATQMGQQAQQYAYGAPPIAARGLAQAAQSQDALNQAGTQTAVGGASAAIGIISALAALCWVADVLYGEGSEPARLARLYANAHDNWFLRLYRRRGRRWAAWLVAHPWAKPLVRPVWDYMVLRGMLMTRRANALRGLGV